ncbi:hypothetical protein [Desulfitobacterium hafniense]|nr:hypothetical protein [Desulfitobacterium hafniense]ACL22704.1 hypothetical protein Dhaf_4709 [Desulfitobacterium hafniense DCB-2]
MGGLAVSDTAYLVAMNSIDHSQVLEYTNYDLVGLPADQRDIILCVVPKNGSAGQVRQVTLASYTDSSFTTTVPSLLPISGNKFMVLWEEFSLKESDWGWRDKIQSDDLCYVYVDAQTQSPIVLMQAGGLIDTKFGGIKESTELRAFGGKREQ